jgi:hypothetical protein
MSFEGDRAKLWGLARRLSPKPSVVFEPIGLFLEDPLAPGNWDYDCSRTRPDKATGTRLLGYCAFRSAATSAEISAGVRPSVATVCVATEV